MPSSFSKYVLFLFFLVSYHTFSQENDSLARYSHKELDSLYRKALNNNIDKTHVYLEKMLANASVKKDTIKIIETFISYTALENYLGNYEKALLYIDKASRLAEKIENKAIQAKCNLIKGNLDYSFGKYESAFELYLAANEYYKSIDHKIMTYSISHNIALIKNIFSDQEGALQILLANYQAAESVPRNQRKKKFSPFFYSSTLLALSDVYTRKAISNPKQKVVLLDSASIYNTLGYKETLEEKDDIGNIYFIIGKGIINYEGDNPKKAIKELNIAIEKIIASKQPNSLTTAYHYKGLSFKKLQQIDSAIVYLKKTDSVSKKNSANYTILQSTYYNLGEIYKAQKDSVNILKYQNLYVENDRINERITGTVRQDIHEKYDIKLLNSEIETLTTTTEEQKVKYTKAIAIIIILLILFFIFFLFYRKQQQKNKLAFEKLMLQLEVNKTKEATPQKNSIKLSIDDEKVTKIIKELDKFEQKKLFLSKNCDLTFVAKKVKTNKAYLSKVIHLHKQQKFIDYIRNLRIDYAVQKLKDDKLFRSYDIKSIAEECGFKSSDSFSRAFVKNTGIYPSFYIKSINKLDV